MKLLERFKARLASRAEQVVQAPFEFGADGRLKEVWVREEWKQFQRGMDVALKRGLQVYMRCDAPACHPFRVTHHRDKDGALIIRCPHKDRLFSRL